MTRFNGTYQWISIPKTGTRAVAFVLRPPEWENLGDHRRYSAEDGGQCVAAIRDPFDRLASALSFEGISTLDLMHRKIEYVDAGYGSFPTAHFYRPQSEFLGPDPVLFLYEKLSDMVRFLGFDGHLPKRNRYPHKIAADFLRKEARYFVESRFADDFDLREELLCTR